MNFMIQAFAIIIGCFIYTCKATINLKNDTLKQSIAEWPFAPVILEPSQESKTLTNITEIILSPKVNNVSNNFILSTYITVIGKPVPPAAVQPHVELQNAQDQNQTQSLYLDYREGPDGTLIFDRPNTSSSLMNEALTLLFNWDIEGALDTILSQDMLTLLVQGVPSLYLSLPYCPKMASVVSPNCGPANVSDPYLNGNSSWHLCGLNNETSVWTPPKDVYVSDLYYAPLIEISQDSILQPCMPYAQEFEDYASPNNIPPILMMAIAYTRTGCQLTNSTTGIFAMSNDDCIKYGCKANHTNIRAATKKMKDSLVHNKDNPIIATAMWNGWYPGMPYNRLQTKNETTHAVPFALYDRDYLDYVLNTLITGQGMVNFTD